MSVGASAPNPNVFAKIRRLLYEHLIRPFQESHAPVREVSWGAAIGMLIAMTPTVGVQMYVAALVWVICRYILRFRFNLPIAIAMVWITNPVTTIPIYYVFLKTGDWALYAFEGFGEPLSYAQFRAEFAAAIDHPGMKVSEKIVTSILLLFWEFGWPMVVGSLFWAIPLAVVSYPVTAVGLHWYRRKLAKAEGISYDEWTRKHVFRNSIPVVPPPPAPAQAPEPGAPPPGPPPPAPYEPAPPPAPDR